VARSKLYLMDQMFPEIHSPWQLILRERRPAVLQAEFILFRISKNIHPCEDLPELNPVKPAEEFFFECWWENNSRERNRENFSGGTLDF